MLVGVHFVIVLTFWGSVSCDLTLEDVYQEVLDLRHVVKDMQTKIQLQDEKIGELNGIIRQQQDLLRHSAAEGKIRGFLQNYVTNKEIESESSHEAGERGMDSGHLPQPFASHPKRKHQIAEMVLGNAGRQREGRLLTGPVPDETTSGIVAFYTYLSTVLAHTDLGQDHTIKFDVVKTNEGQGYHPGSGVFIAPETGFYVFVWTIRVGAYNASLEYHSTELLINNIVYGSVYALAFPDSSKDDSGTGTVVAHVNKGDDVYIRTHSAHHGKGGILSEGFGRSSFAGWKIN